MLHQYVQALCNIEISMSILGLDDEYGPFMYNDPHNGLNPGDLEDWLKELGYL